MAHNVRHRFLHSVLAVPFLRAIENRLQMVADEQTHTLPRTAARWSNSHGSQASPAAISLQRRC
jgi:hypothetical protein